MGPFPQEDAFTLEAGEPFGYGGPPREGGLGDSFLRSCWNPFGSEDSLRTQVDEDSLPRGKMTFAAISAGHGAEFVDQDIRVCKTEQIWRTLKMEPAGIPRRVARPMSEAAGDETRAPPCERWQSLDYENVVRVPDTYGVCVIANSRDEPILVADGVIREMLWKVLNDAAAKAKGASCSAVHVTLLERVSRVKSPLQGFVNQSRYKKYFDRDREGKIVLSHEVPVGSAKHSFGR